MLRRMSADDFMWWRAYERVEPFGEERDDYRAASIAAAVMNATLMAKGLKPTFQVGDMLLEFKEVKAKAQTAEEGKPAAPAPPPTANWQKMKMAARMHFAASKVTKGRAKKAPPTQRKPGGKRK